MSLTTSDAVTAKARRAAEQGGVTIDEIVQQAFTEMARRTERLPRAAIARTIGEFYKYPTRLGELSMTRQRVPELIAERPGARASCPTDVDPARPERHDERAHDHRGRGLGPRRPRRARTRARVPHARVLFAGVRAEHAG